MKYCVYASSPYIGYEPQHDKTNKMTCAPSTDTDQPGHLPSLIRVFRVRMTTPWVLGYSFVGFVVLRLNLLLYKSINLKELILFFYFFFLFCGGCQGGKGDGADVYIIRGSVDFRLQYEIFKMRKFWGQSWSYVISIQKDCRKNHSGYRIQILKQNTCRADHKKFNICCHPTDPQKLPLPKNFYWSS